MATSTSTFELYAFSMFFEYHKISIGDTNHYFVENWPLMRHSGFRLVETITTTGDMEKKVSHIRFARLK